MSRRGESGYALILTVFVVALLSMVLLTVARVQGDLSPSLRRARVETESEALAHSVLARAAFQLLTEPIGPRSLVVGGPRDQGAATGAPAMGGASELRLDGRYYAVGEGAFVAVQDENGLLNLNGGDGVAIAALLERTGVEQRRARAMAAALGDYVDADDLTRAGGAEADAYRRQGAPLLLNHVLTTMWGALDVMGWSEGAPARFWNNVTVLEPGTPINVNTAPFDVLAAALGEDRRAHTVITQRERSEMRTIEDVVGLTGARTDADGATLAADPGHSFRVRILMGAPLQGIEGRLVLNEPGAERPYAWQGEQDLVVEASAATQLARAEPVPASASLTP